MENLFKFLEGQKEKIVVNTTDIGKYVKAGVSLLVLIGIGVAMYYSSRGGSTGTVANANDPRFDPAAVVKDLTGRTVLVQPGGSWTFDPSQQPTVVILQRKAEVDGVVLAVQVNAVSEVPVEDAPPQVDLGGDQQAQPLVSPKKVVPKDQPKPPEVSKASLSGIMRLSYEKIGDTWYLVSVDSITLTALFQ